MAWYWWIITIVLALNGLVMVLIGLILLVDWLRKKREASDTVHGKENTSFISIDRCEMPICVFQNFQLRRNSFTRR